MNAEIKRLYDMSSRTTRRIIGLMSGTSLDGLDIAMCQIEGSGLKTQLLVEHFTTVPYSDHVRAEIRSVFSKQEVNLEKLTLLNEWIGRLHASMILQTLREWNVYRDAVDCIASHGQTIYHAPGRLHGLADYPNATLQIGDGDHIAVGTGIITISDFRQKHIAAGGEGAPLALYGDYILFSSADENRVLLNIGGISNFTYLPAGYKPENIICSDTGPGNTLIDALCQKYFGKPYDEKGEIARSGKVHAALLQSMLSHPFFWEESPKTTGPELFNLSFIDAAKSTAGCEQIEPADLVATASELTSLSVANTIKRSLDHEDYVVYASGGGCHNSFVMERIKQHLSGPPLSRTEQLGFNADAKEAALFALLANETICGSAVQSAAGPAITMGKISLPN